nr:MAG TPA: hypothetical protein [Caudoviricetes sp.]
MKAEDILTLVRAGFTRSDLSALGVTVGTPAVKQEEPAVKQAEPPAEKPAVKKEDAPVDIAAIVSQAVAATVGEMQRNNMLGAQQPKQETVDDILAQIIAPTGGAN